MEQTLSPIDKVLDSYDKPQAQRLEELREIIHDTAEDIPQIKRLEECLKWGQPSFVVKPDRIGSTVRIDKSGDGVSVYFICTTGLVDQFREIYPESFNYVGNREIHFGLKDKLPKDELKHCIAMAFTHHLNKKKKS